MQINPNASCSVGPFSVISGDYSVAEWLPDDKNGYYVGICEGVLVKSSILNIGDAKVSPDPAFVRLVRAGIIGSPTSVNLDVEFEPLYNRIVAYLRRTLWFVEDFDYYAVASYIIMTWGFQAFDCVPYLRFSGDFDTGKTTALRVVAALAFRSVATVGALTSAQIYRMAGKVKGTYLFDEADFRATGREADIVKILNCGYSKGTPILRLGSNYEPLLFDVFGPKVISSREPFDDAALESRFITIDMHARNHGIERLADPDLQVEATEIRNGCLAFRLNNTIVPDPEDEAVFIKEFQDNRFEPRLVQIGLPLMHSTPDEHRDKIVEFLLGVKLKYRRLRTESILAQILRAYIECTGVVCKISDVRKELNKDAGKKYSLKALAGLAVKMGFEKFHTRNGAAIRAPSDEWTNQMRKVYYV